MGIIHDHERNKGRCRYCHLQDLERQLCVHVRRAWLLEEWRSLAFVKKNNCFGQPLRLRVRTGTASRIRKLFRRHSPDLHRQADRVNQIEWIKAPGKSAQSSRLRNTRKLPRPRSASFNVWNTNENKDLRIRTGTASRIRNTLSNSFCC